MIAKWLKGCLSRFRESHLMLDDVFRRRSASKKEGPTLTDGEFYSCFNYNKVALKDLKDVYRDRDFESAADELIRYYRTKRHLSVKLCLEPAFKKRIKAFSPSQRKLIRIADMICAHNIIMPTGHSAEFGTFINWHSDFCGKNWMYLHISDLLKSIHDRTLAKQYDIKTLPISLEFNKHHHFVVLARAFALTLDEKYTQEFTIQLEDWIQRNPVNFGISWIDPMTVAQRLISWIFALAIFLELSSYLQGEHLQKIMKMMLLHGAYLTNCLTDKNQRSSSSIAAASALYMAASFFPEFECAERWKNKAVRMLETESSAEFLPDGVYKKRSMGMQVLLTEFLMLPLICDKLFGISSSPAILSIVERSLEFLMYAQAPSGLSVNFGDSPATHVWYFSNVQNEDYRNLLCIGAYIFNRGDMKFLAGKISEDFLWFFKTQGEKKYEEIVPNAPVNISQAFVDSGYFAFRNSWNQDATYCLFYGNPKKPVPFIDKGLNIICPHRDLLSFALFVRGEPFIIETGSYKGVKKIGTADPADYFSKTSAHNSLIVDGKEQSIAKNIKSSRKFMHLLKTRWFFSEEFDYVMSCNFGFEDLKGVLVHKREILYLKEKKWTLIKDSLEGSEEFNVANLFHLAPELDISLRGDYGCLIHARREYIRLNMYYPGPFECRPSRGKINPISGWHAKDFSRLEPCHKIEYTSKVKLPAQIYTWISWARNEYRIPPKDVLEEAFITASQIRGIKEGEVQFEVPAAK